MLNQVLHNRYKVTALLGRGAMGMVYRAVDRTTRQEVAIKVIAHDVVPDAELLARFRREGEALRQLRHRNIVAFVEMFEHQDQQVIVMEYVPGGNLHSLIEAGPLAPADVVRLTLELSDALAQAHYINIIHRDIKPQNVLLTADGVPKLTDFGIARLLGETTNLTQSGVMVGTPHYMSPEAWQGQPPDAQGDIWSMGVMVYQMVSGLLPFAGDTLPVVMHKILSEAPTDLRALRPETPEALVRVIERMLERDRSLRYESMRQIAVDLEQIQRDTRRAQQETRQRAETAPPSGLPETKEVTRETREMPPKTPTVAQPPTPPPPPTPRPVTAAPTPKPSAAGPAPARPPRQWALFGVGGLLILTLLAVGGYSLWAGAGKFLALAPAPATATPIIRVVQGPSNTPWPTATVAPVSTKIAPSPTPKPPTPTVTPSPRPSATATPTAPILTATSPAAPRPTQSATQVSVTDGMPQVYVPAGPFLMGSADSDPMAQKNEKPQHTVDLDAFWIDRTDVTNAMYAQCVSAGACQAPKSSASKTRPDYYTNPQYAPYPVVFVTWDDAKAYCSWAGRRLPTEAEWEKAARGTEGALYPWGNQPFDDTRGALQPTVKDTVPVGSYPAGASPYGALDMAGNVWQWVADWYDANYYANSPSKNPPGPASGTLRILRGGSWDVVRPYVRAAVRDSYQGEVTYEVIGFRCAQSP